jgi:hypothetical protein
LARRSTNVPSAGSISKLKTFGWRGRKGRYRTAWLGAQDVKPFPYRGG